MRNIRRFSNTSMGALSAVLVVVLAFTIASCTGSTNAPVRPSAIGEIGAANVVGGVPGNCPNIGTKDETAPFGSCSTGSTIYIKAGNTCYTLPAGDTQVFEGSTLCYEVNSGGFVVQVGPGPTCKGISHINCAPGTPTPTPTPEEPPPPTPTPTP